MTGEYVCVRHSAEGRYLGWCAIKHRYKDRAITHARTLNRSNRLAANPEPWIVKRVEEWTQERMEAFR